MAKINLVDLSDHPIRLTEVQNAKLPTRPEHTMKLRQSFVVISQVAKAESRRNEVKRSIPQRQVQRIGLQRYRTSMPRRWPRKFLGTTRQHLMRKVGSQHRTRANRPMLQE